MADQSQTFLSVKEAAKLSGLSSHTLRYYERIGLIQPVARDPSSGHRRYNEDDIEILQSLSYLKMCGFPIADIRTYAKFRYTNQVDEEAMKEMFIEHEQKFKQRIERLRLQHKYIQCKVAYWEARCTRDEKRLKKVITESQAIAQKLIRS